MFEQLSNRFARIVKDLKGHGKITDKNITDTLRDIRRALLEADVNIHAAKSFINRVKDSASGENVFTSVTPGQQFVKIMLNELTSFLGRNNDGIRFNFFRIRRSLTRLTRWFSFCRAAATGSF